MIRALLTVLTIFVAGCGDRRDPDTVNLEIALKITESGEYSLIVVFDGDSTRFVSFQKSWDHKKQYYFEAEDRSAVLEKVAEAIRKARKDGHSIGTMGGEEILED